MAVLATLVGWAVVVAACVVLLRGLLKYIDFRRCEMAIPGPPSTLLLGNTLDVMAVTEATVFPTAMKMWGGRTEMSRFSILNKLIVFVSDPNDLALVFRSKEFANKSRFFYEFLEYLAPKGLVVLNGTEWKRHRMATQPAFHHEVLDSYDELFVDESETFVKRIAPNQELDLHDNLYYLLSRSFVRTAMTSQVQDERILFQVVTFLQTFLRSLNERSIKPWLWSDWLFSKTATYKVLKEGAANVADFCAHIMKGRKERLAAEPDTEAYDFLKKKKTLLDVLIDAQMDNKFDIKIEDEHIMDEILVFIGAAVETSASTISSALKCLSFYPDVQEKLYAEVKQVLGDCKRSVTLDDLAKMTYLDHVIKETLRTVPTIPFIAREVCERTEFAGKVLPAGTTLVINIYGAHRDPRHWVEPLRFNPDRFANDEARHPYAFIPFSAGSRNCIGGRYALQLIKTVLATTLRDFRVDRAADGLTDHNQLPLTFDLAMRVYGGTRVILTPRGS